jgi:hypothetical protein
VGDRQKEEKRQRKDGKMDYIHKERQRTKDGLTMKEQQTEGKKNKSVVYYVGWSNEQIQVPKQSLFDMHPRQITKNKGSGQR